ncbi:FeoB-associated Cys-rich membrane protein [Butyrivibrio sp. M55]|nr:Virus attachment protein p12 family protein [Butyrivibrio sp. M55]
MVNIIAFLALVLILGLAIGYIYKEKKKGTHCIGCPSAGNCRKARNCNRK